MSLLIWHDQSFFVKDERHAVRNVTVVLSGLFLQLYMYTRQQNLLLNNGKAKIVKMDCVAC